MATIEILSKKIETLKNNLLQVTEDNKEEKSKLQTNLDIILECEEFLKKEANYLLN